MRAIPIAKKMKIMDTPVAVEDKLLQIIITKRMITKAREMDLVAQIKPTMMMKTNSMRLALLWLRKYLVNNQAERKDMKKKMNHRNLLKIE